MSVRGLAGIQWHLSLVPLVVCLGNGFSLSFGPSLFHYMTHEWFRSHCVCCKYSLIFYSCFILKTLSSPEPPTWIMAGFSSLVDEVPQWRFPPFFSDLLPMHEIINCGCGLMDSPVFSDDISIHGELYKMYYWLTDVRRTFIHTL